MLLILLVLEDLLFKIRDGIIIPYAHFFELFDNAIDLVEFGLVHFPS